MISIASKPHQSLFHAIETAVKQDTRIIGLLAGGSLIHGGFDEFSDIDLVLVVNEDDHLDVMRTRREFAESIGDLLASFTGEHVGEPRLLICLYGDPPIHVDLKFVTLAEMGRMVERPLIAWTRTPDVETSIQSAKIEWPNQTVEWFEERFWIWAHYAATKIGRGELYEALGMLGFLREQVLGPLIHSQSERPQRGIRRLEEQFPDWSERLANTVADHNRGHIALALKAAIDIYQELIDQGRRPNRRAAHVVIDYVDDICD